MEPVTRAKTIVKHLMDGEYYHNDFAKYQIHMQSCVYGCKPILLRTEIKDIFNRMSTSGMDVKGRLLVEGSVPAVPKVIDMFLDESKCYKIEWMDHGRYYAATNKTYADNFMGDTTIQKFARKYNLPPKLVDYSGFNNFDMPYRMWSESLYLPGSVINYTGACLWRSDNVLCYSTIRILTVLVNHSAMVTATRMSRGRRFVM